MPYTDTWNAAFEAAPADTDQVAEGAERIRDTRVGIRERMAKDHYMDIAGTDADHGEHVKVTLRVGAAATLHADAVVLYAKDVSAKAHLFYIDEDGTERRIEAFPSGTNMLFYQDTAPLGWTIENTLDDRLVFVTKGSAAGGQTGGGMHSTGSWTITGIAADSHTLTVAEIPEHFHTIPFYLSSNNGGGAGAGCWQGGPMNTSSTGGGGGHGHTASHSPGWRPAAYCCIIAAKD